MMVGVVGKANVGKSTFFKAVTLGDVLIANYPFATIKPNSGVGYVKIDCVDKEFDTQCNPRTGHCQNHKRFVPVELIDVAGLVPGAYEGKGMGNQFLDDIRQADVLIHVIDAAGATNDKGEPVEPGTHDPADDVRFLEIELDMWYLGILKKGWEKFARTIQQTGGKIEVALAKQLSGVGVDEDMANIVIRNLGLPVDSVISWTESQLRSLAVEFRKLTKPMVIAANKMDVGNGRDNLERLKKEFPEHRIIGCSAESELALKEAAKHGLIEYIPGEDDFKITSEDRLNDTQKAALGFIRDNVLKRNNGSGVQDILDTAVFGLLGYIAIFPGGVNKLADSDGNVLPDCFLMPPDSTALDFAFKLHTDFGKNFIRAIDVKKKITVGKEYKLNHRDVIEIISSK
ncbi:translation-associated GTPase [Candidatus Woesearchaeota archaeon CG11_big_fil_rev_8_21_14_0_20_43_8]|nr:MAG: translation-associated GTPase [Candidatus Woesearchaeota archaeon CG11_big_fil_rev_8_21_14_0_20_43_8]PIO05188.1 MAG: translation-associated GTPase [Candidatus Woesearchaeota archaeon CG08_land_8_20_14_0_20_43_7]